MVIRVLAFGVVKEMFGHPFVDVRLDDTVNVAQLKQQLEQQYPALGGLTSFMIAVNGDYAQNDCLINADNEIAIIPPVSGG